MDPNETLRMLREAAEEARNTNDELDAMNLALHALNYAESLDEWMSNGGFLPTDWER